MQLEVNFQVTENHVRNFVPNWAVATRSTEPTIMGLFHSEHDADSFIDLKDQSRKNLMKVRVL